jgi:DNA-directed RNA polymerase subunit N (RpoN/RPB10)
MIIPIRCFTCGNILADKYDFFIKESDKLLKESDKQNINEIERSAILNQLELNRYCCRRHMLATEDMMLII